MSLSEMNHTAAEIQQVLLLVWVHGFKGNKATFADFPDDVGAAAQERFSDHDVRSIIYPKYRTVGELDVAVDALVGWLYRYVLDLEREKVDSAGSGVHTTVILFGHSMGGMLVADAAKEVSDEKKRNPGRDIADVCGVIAIDTPFIGIHPALVSYGMEQLDAYIDKTLLDTAAFFENSPKFMKNGLKKMGISTDKAKPASGKKPLEGPGRLEKGFTSMLAIPGQMSNSEWDWMRESEGGGWKGLKRVVSEATGRKGTSQEDQAVSGKAIEGSKGEEEGGASGKEALSRIASSQSIPPPLPPRRGTQPTLRSASDQSSTNSGVKSVEPANHLGIAEEVHPAVNKTGSTNEASTVATTTASSEPGRLVTPSINERIPSSRDSSLSSSPPWNIEPKPLDATLNSPSPPPSITSPKLPPRPSQSHLNSPMLSLTLHQQHSASSSTSSLDHTPMKDPSDLGSGKDSTAAKKEQQKKNWRWVKSHTEFMASCWSVREISGRMKGIEEIQRRGVYFVNIYTIVRPTSPAHPKDRTFVSLPTIHHPTKDSWKPFIHDSAADQVEAHMALFNKEKHKGYGRLIGVICDEIEEVLKRAK